jgi:hypothetical protein
MGLFLIASALGFTIYQIAAWAFVSDDWLLFKIGESEVSLTPRDAAWLRRIVGAVLIGFGLSVAVWLHWPFISIDDLVGGVVVLGFFFGPLLAIWINTLLAKPAEEALSVSQSVGGVGLVLLFLVGSFGHPIGDLIKKYANRINKIGIAGTELVFTQKPADMNPLGGSLPLSGAAPTYASSTGAIGLDYLYRLDSMIERDGQYLVLFRDIERRQDQAPRSFVDQAASDRLAQDSQKKSVAADLLLGRLREAKSFAELTIKKPADCMIGWYSVTGDTAPINRHLAGFAEIFRQLPTVESDQLIAELAGDFVKESFLVGEEAVASVPSAFLADKCDDLLQQFCPEAFSIHDKPHLDYIGHEQPIPQRERDNDHLATCLKQIKDALAKGEQTPALKKPLDEIRPYVTGFVKDRGWDERPYFALGYASILSELGQRQAASALLDAWIQTRFVRPVQWELAADWFDVRMRTFLANFLEDWIIKEGSAAPTVLRDEHIANLELVKADLEGRLRAVDFFKDISLAVEKASPEKMPGRLREPRACNSRDPDSDLWRRLFETYVTTELTYLNALMDHPRYAEALSGRAMMVAAELINTDLSCIPLLEKDLTYPRARTYYAQILDAYGRNAFRYSAAHWDSEDNGARTPRLADAARAVQFGLDLIREIAQKERVRTGAPFLRRIEPSDAVETEEKLKLTAVKLRQMKDYSEQQ